MLSGVYAAIYGVLLTNRDGQLTHNVAERIYKYHYENQVKILVDKINALNNKAKKVI